MIYLYLFYTSTAFYCESKAVKKRKRAQLIILPFTPSHLYLSVFGRGCTGSISEVCVCVSCLCLCVGAGRGMERAELDMTLTHLCLKIRKLQTH